MFSPPELRPCHRRIAELRGMLDEKAQLADGMADDVERLCLQVKRQIDIRDVILSVEEVQDLFRRGRRT